jgi:hypothetical protein
MAINIRRSELLCDRRVHHNPLPRVDILSAFIGEINPTNRFGIPSVNRVEFWKLFPFNGGPFRLLEVTWY